MLILSRKSGEAIQIGDCVRVTVLGITGNRVKLGLEAPDSVHIVRGELSAVNGFSLEEDAESLSSPPLLAQ